jgi:hypothetical protein
MLKIYYVSNTHGNIEINQDDKFKKDLALYDKYIYFVDDIISSDFILITLRANSSISEINKCKNDYILYKLKVIFYIYALQINDRSRENYYNTDSQYDDIFDDEYIFFTSMNVTPRKNIIFVPLPPMPSDFLNGSHIAKLKVYDEKKIKYTQQIYFSGSPTHQIRTTVCDFFKNKQNCKIKLNDNISFFWEKKITNDYYAKHILNCLNSDITLLIRGDREFCYVFCDYLYSGNIICFINANSYINLGFEKIGFDVNKMFLFYDINNISIDQIYEELVLLLTDKNKILEMKKTIKKFYDDFIYVDRAFSSYDTKSVLYAHIGFTHFYIAKLIEIYHNNYILKDNKFFSHYVMDIIKNI